MARRWRARPLLAFTGAGMALLLSASVATASFLPYGTIVFVSDRAYTGAGSDIYTMNADGTGMTRLTTTGATENDPVLSPDGSKVAYEVGGHIWIQNLAGGSPVDLLAGCVPHTSNPCGIARTPAWSPDGTKIAFWFSDAPSWSYIQTVRLADGVRGTVVYSQGYGQGVAWPAWSPDGGKIAYSSYYAGSWGIVIKDLDGGSRGLTTGRTPAWSADGNYIAYVDDATNHGWESQYGDDIYVVPACDFCSGEPMPVAMAYGRDWNPSWSRDGTMILFQSERWHSPPAATDADAVFHLYVADVFPWDDPYPGYHDEFWAFDLSTFSSAQQSGGSNGIDYSDTVASWHWPLYDISDFFSPVRDYHGMKAGAAAPIKFSLGGDQGLDLFATGYPRSVSSPCTIGANGNDPVETINAGGSSLTYDPVAEQYVYVWKTDKTWKGTCRDFQIMFKDGTLVTALFSFW